MKRGLFTIVSLLILSLLFSGCGTGFTTPGITDLSRDDGSGDLENGDVQGYIYETAYGFSDCYNVESECFIPTFGNWGWTTPMTVGDTGWLDLWAGAAQCDNEKGTKVGRLYVDYQDGCVTVSFDLYDDHILEEYHVYVGSTKFPEVTRGKKIVSTVAPGQYYNDCENYSEGDEVYIIVHAVVGIPQ